MKISVGGMILDQKDKNNHNFLFKEKSTIYSFSWNIKSNERKIH